jgi:branched-chain amino acid transport system permease protein
MALSRATGLFALAALAPLIVDDVGLLNSMVLAAAYAVMALGLNIIVGFAGLLDLGYVAFFAIGAYTAVYFASGYWANASVGGRPGIHLNVLLVMLIAALAAALAGALLGAPTLRLRGDYIAVVTLAFGEIVAQIVYNGRGIALFGGTLTAGLVGVGPVDRIDLPFVGRLGPSDLRAWYWCGLTLVALVLLANRNLRRSRIGRAWVALRDDERAAAVAGVPIARTKLTAYATGAALGGLAGAFFASYLSIVNPDQFDFGFSIFILAMVVLGGLGSPAGVVAGAVVLSMVNTWVLREVPVDLSAISAGLYGAVLVVMTLIRPAGLFPARSSGIRTARPPS